LANGCWTLPRWKTAGNHPTQRILARSSPMASATRVAPRGRARCVDLGSLSGAYVVAVYFRLRHRPRLRLLLRGTVALLRLGLVLPILFLFLRQQFLLVGVFLLQLLRLLLMLLLD